MNPAVSEYFDNIQQAWQAEICKKLDAVIRQVIPDVEDRLQYKKPHYLKNGKYACVIGTAKGWVSFTIFNMDGLEIPDGFFEPSDVADRQTIKIRDGQAVDYSRLQHFIEQACLNLEQK